MTHTLVLLGGVALGFVLSRALRILRATALAARWERDRQARNRLAALLLSNAYTGVDATGSEDGSRNRWYVQ